jgi:Uma2 family endonuclease
MPAAVASIPQPAPPVNPRSGEPTPKRWSRDDYYRLAESGLFRGKRVFLLSGDIYEMAAQGNWHSVTVGKALSRLQKVFPESAYWVRPQMPLDLDDGTSDPEPDLAVVPGTPDDYATHPSTALLVVEVSDTSLAMDRKKKAPYYAAARVPEYWILNLQDRVLEVHREPVLDAAHPWQPDGPPLARYAQAQVLKPGDTIAPVAAPQATIVVADLFPARPPGETF